MIAVFHGWHETVFDLAAIRRVNRCYGTRRNKFRSGGKGNERRRCRSSPPTRHRQRESLPVALFNPKRSRHDLRRRGRRDAHGDGARFAFYSRRECGRRLVRFAPAFAG